MNVKGGSRAPQDPHLATPLHPDKDNQLQSRTGTIDFNIFLQPMTCRAENKESIVSILLCDWLKDLSQPRPEILEIRHFRCHRNHENCMAKRNCIAAPQVVLLEVC